jgi:hypothetical protein
MKKTIVPIGARDKQKLTAIFKEIEEHEKTAVRLVVKTARAYYDAGNILMGMIKNWDGKKGNISVKAIADAGGFKEYRVNLALKVFKGFENRPELLKELTLRAVFPMPLSVPGCSRGILL